MITYSVSGHGTMIADKVRTQAYLSALQLAVKPDSVVLDLGAGTGFFALMACRFGARRVFAIEPGDIINTAREVAKANGLEKSIEFYQAMSTEVSLPERADVIVSDLRGVLPLFERHLPSIVDARKRLLAPGGSLIPRSDSLWVACVSAPDLHAEVTSPWSDNAFGLDMRSLGRLQANQWRKAPIKPDQLLTEPVCCGSIDYATVVSPNLSMDVALTAQRSGVADGLCVWFDAVLADGIVLTNSPGSPELVYGKAYFPWPERLALTQGDEVRASLSATLIGDDYVWRWVTTTQSTSGQERTSIRFDQSNFFGEPMSPAKLRKQSSEHVPVLDEDGQIEGLALGLMAQNKSLGEIAREVASRFPNRFSSWQDSFERVAALSVRFSR
jgi:type I protein arginine methyltransferase